MALDVECASKQHSKPGFAFYPFRQILRGSAPVFEMSRHLLALK